MNKSVGSSQNSSLLHLFSSYLYKRKNLLLIALIFFLIDQVSKGLIRFFDPTIEVFAFFHIIFVENSGIAFSLFSGYNIVFILLNMLLLGVIIHFFDYFGIKKQLTRALSLIVGGGFGNVLDRILFGKVTDFIAIGWWPVFNFADSFIVCGVFYLLFFLIIQEKKEKSQKKAKKSNDEK